MTEGTSSYPVRLDLAAAHARAWDRLAHAGTWLDGPTRIRVAAETRHAPGCVLCVRCKAALSPYAVEGTHDGCGELPGNWIETIHRIVADPGRLTHAWYRRMLASGIADTEYVEIVSVIAHVTAIDTFARGLGIPAQPLPAPLLGAPSHFRPRRGATARGLGAEHRLGRARTERGRLFRLPTRQHPPRFNPGARRSAELLRSSRASISAGSGDARFRPRIPGDNACADRAARRPDLCHQPVRLLNDQPCATAPCEQST
jgi:hypothetical protein